ncbi:uncharacterized protein At5g41620-like isoform X1 [Typha angustifolia]|uniref:uncharacterized protein At5g41620-like isoform X1 n=1 Tax=Typha angustifolia TaxID=59011 RepID=UPI003C2B0142
MEERNGVPIDGGGNEKESLGLKLKRGIALSKKGGPCTPVPTWKLEESSDPSELDGLAKAPVAAPRRSSVSARQLGANLWEIQEPRPLNKMGRRGHRTHRHGEGKEPHDETLQNYGRLRRHATASLIDHHTMNRRSSQAVQDLSSASYCSSMGVAANQAVTPSSSLDLKTMPGEASFSITTSTELLKVLNRIWSLEEQHATNVSLVKALKVELQKALERVQDLKHERQEYHDEMEALMRQASEEKVIRKNKEQERIKAAVQSIKDELQDERYLRKRSESLHRKLGKEVSELKAALLKAVKDLEKEKKVNWLLEDLCDEFAKGIKNYEVEVRELKQRSVKDYAHKFESFTLHIAEAWLDERMQIQIAKARGDLAEQCAIRERLSGEIQTFLQSRLSCISKNDDTYKANGNRDGNLRRQSLESVHLNGTASAPQDAEDNDSESSDFQCFELNMGAHDTKSHDQLKIPHENGIENFGSTRKSNFIGKIMEYSENTNCHSSSSMHVKFVTGKGRTKSSDNNMQLVDGAEGANTLGDSELAGLGAAQSEIAEAQEYENCHVQEIEKFTQPESDGMLSLKNNSEYSEVHNGGYLGKSQNHFSWRGQCNEGFPSGELHNLSSPMQQRNYQRASLDIEITECSPKQQRGVEENTLKAKLLEARLEGRHARLRASRVSSTGRIRK